MQQEAPSSTISYVAATDVVQESSLTSLSGEGLTDTSSPVHFTTDELEALRSQFGFGIATANQRRAEPDAANQRRAKPDSANQRRAKPDTANQSPAEPYNDMTMAADLPSEFYAFYFFFTFFSY